MQRITRDKLTPVFDRRTLPVATVRRGERFIVETEDSRGGLTRTPQTTTPEYLIALRQRGYHGNPVTGPIYVEGARPGDTLAVHIHAQECDTLGYMGYWPWLFHLEDFFDKPSTVLCEIRDGHVRIANDEHPNGFLLSESYLASGVTTPGERIVGLDPNQFFVLGDNRRQSFDSKDFGAIPRRAIIGRAWLRGWPIEKFGRFDPPQYVIP
jgi:hypothetical protein